MKSMTTLAYWSTDWNPGSADLPCPGKSSAYTVAPGRRRNSPSQSDDCLLRREAARQMRMRFAQDERRKKRLLSECDGGHT